MLFALVAWLIGSLLKVTKDEGNNGVEVKINDPNITMEEHIRLEEEKAQRYGRMFNWKTTTFRKVKYYKDEDDCFTDFETEFPAIVFDNTLMSDIALPCEPTVSPPNENKIDFRISLDESNDEDYTKQYGVSTTWIRHMAPLPPADQRHLWLRYQVEGYTENIVHNYEHRLKTIWVRSVNQVHILDFEDLTPEIRHDMVVRLRMVYTRGNGSSISGRGQAPEKVVTHELLLIDLHELGRLNICSRYGDTWAWVAQGPERQQPATTGAHAAVVGAPATDDGAHAILAPVQEPRPLPPAPYPRRCHIGSIGSRRRCMSYDRVLWACKEWVRALLPSRLGSPPG
nr:hypothetical protein [Tanacetum cinerariifolium]